MLRKSLKYIFKILTIVPAVAGILLSYFWPTGYMVGMRTFLYFTTLSNVFMIAVCVWGIAVEAADARKAEKPARRTYHAVKHMFTVSMIVTFITFYAMAAGGLLSGDESLRKGMAYLASIPSNWTVHFLAPLFSVTDLFACDPPVEKRDRRKVKWYGLVFPFCYAAGTILMSLGGVRFTAELGIAPYFFLDYVTYTWWELALMWAGLGTCIYFLNNLVFFVHDRIRPESRPDGAEDAMQQ